MHFSTQNSAALAVALFCTSSVASGVKAAPVPRVSLGNVADGVGIASDIAQGVAPYVHKREPEPKGRLGKIADGVGIASDIAQGVGALAQKREPEPFNLGGLLKDGEKVLGSVLKREPKRVSLGDVADGVGIASDIAQGVGAYVHKREPEPFNLGGLLKDGEKVLGAVLKREPEPKKVSLGEVADGVGIASDIAQGVAPYVHKREPEPKGKLGKIADGVGIASDIAQGLSSL